MIGVAGQSGVLRYFPTFATMFEDFPNTKPLPFDETYAGITGTKVVAIYPMLAKVRVVKRVMQLAMQVISTPDDYNIEDSRDAILIMVLTIPEELRIQSVESALQIMAWSALSQFDVTWDLEGSCRPQRQKIDRLKVTTREHAENIIDMVFRLMPKDE